VYVNVVDKVVQRHMVQVERRVPLGAHVVVLQLKAVLNALRLDDVGPV
jgi:hypothetical protein